MKKSDIEKNNFVKCISGKIVKKYKFKRTIENISSRCIGQTKNHTILEIKRNRWFQIKRTVENYFERDEVSRICAGKKETITFKKKIKSRKDI